MLSLNVLRGPCSVGTEKAQLRFNPVQEKTRRFDLLVSTPQENPTMLIWAGWAGLKQPRDSPSILSKASCCDSQMPLQKEALGSK